MSIRLVQPSRVERCLDVPKGVNKAMDEIDFTAPTTHAMALFVRLGAQRSRTQMQPDARQRLYSSDAGKLVSRLRSQVSSLIMSQLAVAPVGDICGCDKYQNICITSHLQVGLGFVGTRRPARLVAASLSAVPVQFAAPNVKFSSGSYAVR